MARVLMTLLLVFGLSTACAARLSSPASQASALLIGRVVVHELREGPRQPWPWIHAVWRDPSGRAIRSEIGEDALFLLANLEPGEYTLTRLVLVRHGTIRGHPTTESFSLSLPSPWRVRVDPGAAVIAGELAVEIHGDRIAGASVVPLSRSARLRVAERLAGTGWAERAGTVNEAPVNRLDSGRALVAGAPRLSGPDHAVLSYRGAGRSIVVDASVNGRKAGRFLVDTGASLTVISRRLAEEAEARFAPEASAVTLHTANGPVEAPLATLASLGVGGLEVGNVPVAVHDLPGIGRGIDGLLGMSFLRYFRLTIDPERREMTLDRR